MAFTSKMFEKHVFLKHFAGKNQLPGLSVSGTLVEDGLNLLVSIAHIELLALFWNRSYSIGNPYLSMMYFILSNF